MREHTPGPWDVYSGELRNVKARKVFVQPQKADGEFAGIVAEMPINTYPTAVQVANARLVAAAPDLLEAARAIAAMADVLRAGSHTPTMLNATRHKIMRDAARAADKARAAIAKAEGDYR